MILFILLFALLIGSFLNVCIYRIPRNKSISFPPSHCTNCNTSLKPVDLIPVLSYLYLKGSCRYCGEKISPKYPIVEALNGILWVILYLRFGLSFEFYGLAVLSSLLLVISVIDLEIQEIPDGLNILGFIAGIIYIAVQWDIDLVLSSFAGLLIGSGLFFLIAFLSKGGMGGGDIKLLGVLGIWLGWKLTMLLILLSFFIGALVSVFLIITKIKSRKDYIPFGPFIAIGAYIAIIFGDFLIDWYLNLLI